MIELHRGRDGQAERQNHAQIGIVDEAHNRLIISVEAVQRGSHPTETAFVVEEDVVRESDAGGQVGVPTLVVIDGHLILNQMRRAPQSVGTFRVDVQPLPTEPLARI